MEELHLILGCFGRTDDGFVTCSSCENKILKISSDRLNNYDDIISYLDSIKLLDKPLLDYNAIRNSVFRMQSKFDQGLSKLWSEKEFRLYENFTLVHKPCGIYMQLKYVDMNEIVETKEQLVRIQAEPSLDIPVVPIKKTEFRGRR